MRRLPPKVDVLFTNQVMTDDVGIYNYDRTNYSGYQGVKLVLLADTEAGTDATFDAKFQAKHTAENVWYDIPGASLAQITANQSAAIDLVIHPAITAVSNRAVAQVLPRDFRVVFTVGDATGEGFTASAELHYIS